jgi:hypothetical protein
MSAGRQPAVSRQVRRAVMRRKAKRGVAGPSVSGGVRSALRGHQRGFLLFPGGRRFGGPPPNATTWFLPAPTAAEEIYAAPISSQAALVFWKVPKEPGVVDYYVVQRRDAGGSWVDVATSKLTSYFDNTLTAETDYEWRVQTVQIDGQVSGYSETVLPDRDGVAASQTPGGAGNLTLGGSTTHSPPRKIGIYSASDISSRVFTVVGTNRFDQAITETVTGVNGSTVFTSTIFKTTPTISVDAATGAAVEVGWGATATLTTAETEAALPAATLFSVAYPSAAEGDPITITGGIRLVIDEATPNLGEVTIEDGYLDLSDPAGHLTCENIHIEGVSASEFGALIVGSPTSPAGCHLTLTGEFVEGDAHPRSIMLHGYAKLLVFGPIPDPIYSQLNAHAADNATSFTLRHTTNWATGAGKEVAVGPTDHYALSSTNRLTLDSAAGNTISTTAGITEPRFGKLQYPYGDFTDPDSPKGISETSLYFNPPHSEVPRVIDERATVAPLYREALFESIVDSQLTVNKFGMHIMIMDPTCTVQAFGLKVKNGGQQGLLGRYGFMHWHACSQELSGGLATGVYRGAIPFGNAVVYGCVADQSQQRAGVVHATDGVVLVHNVSHDGKGHQWFLEDAVERNNYFVGNRALKVRPPDADKILAVGGAHEADNVSGESGSSGFWITNMDNVLWDNLGIDCNGMGFWMAVPLSPLGLSGAAPRGLGGALTMDPHSIAPLSFRDNGGQSCFGVGISFRGAPIDSAGTTDFQTRFQPGDGAGGPLFGVVMEGLIAMKCAAGGYTNTFSFPKYIRCRMIGNWGFDFNGQVSDAFGGSDAKIWHNLGVKFSLNNANARPARTGDTESWPQLFGTSYHSSANFVANAMFNYIGTPYHAGLGAGDYYVRAVDRGTIRNIDNMFVNSRRALRGKPGHRAEGPSTVYKATFAGALEDSSGEYTGIPGTGYWIFDNVTYDDSNDRFLSFGSTLTDVPALDENGDVIPGERDGYKSTSQYYGLTILPNWWDSGGYAPPGDPYQFRARLNFRRWSGTYGAFTQVGKWDVPTGAPGTGNPFPWMRHMAAEGPPSGAIPIYTQDYDPADPDTSGFVGELTNLSRATDKFIVGFKYDEATASDVHYAAGYVNATGGARRTCTAAADWDEVYVGDGDKYWIGGGYIWILFVGGLPYPYYDLGNFLAQPPVIAELDDDNALNYVVGYQVAA